MGQGVWQHGYTFLWLCGAFAVSSVSSPVYQHSSSQSSSGAMRSELISSLAPALARAWIDQLVNSESSQQMWSSSRSCADMLVCSESSLCIHHTTKGVWPQAPCHNPRSTYSRAHSLSYMRIENNYSVSFYKKRRFRKIKSKFLTLSWYKLACFHLRQWTHASLYQLKIWFQIWVVDCSSFIWRQVLMVPFLGHSACMQAIPHAHRQFPEPFRYLTCSDTSL